LITVHELTHAFGAEIQGLEPRVPLDDATCALLRETFDRCGLLVFRDLDLDHSDQVYLAKMLIGREGEVDDPSSGRFPISDNWYISNHREQSAVPFGRLQFHSDGMCDEEPIEVVSLYGIEVQQPAIPTTFVSAVEAWRTLPPGLLAQVEGRCALHTSGEVRRRDITDVVVTKVDRLRTSVKPLGLAHPRTGATVLFVCEQMTEKILDLDADDSEHLLEELFDHMYTPAARLDHEWRECDLVVWDNIAVQHARPNVLEDGPTRTLRKVAYPMPMLTPDQLPAYSRED
jgi:alpha-ketoglutarate-dependent taurine dioxygenase